MARKRKTKKQKMRSEARKKRVQDDKKEDNFAYTLSTNTAESPEIKKRSDDYGEKKKKRKTTDRLTAVYPSIIEDTRYSIFVSIAIFLVYALIYFLL